MLVISNIYYIDSTYLKFIINKNLIYKIIFVENIQNQSSKELLFEILGSFKIISL